MPKFKCDILSIFQTIWLCWEIMLLKILTIFLNVGSSVDAIVLEKVLKFLHLWKSNECRGCWPHFSEFSAVYAAKRGSTTSLLVSFLLLLLLLAWSWSWPSPRLPQPCASPPLRPPLLCRCATHSPSAKTSSRKPWLRLAFNDYYYILQDAPTRFGKKKQVGIPTKAQAVFF